jgi:hypothetical protein
MVTPTTGTIYLPQLEEVSPLGDSVLYKLSKCKGKQLQNIF